MRDLYVSLLGNDHWSGALPDPAEDGKDGPFRTVAAAQRHARRLIATGLRKPLSIYFRQGTHVLDRTLTFRPADSGTARNPVTYASFPGEAATLSGGVRIADWQTTTVHGQPCWMTDLPGVAEGAWYFTQLFVNGERCQRPRLPRTGFHRFTGVAGHHFEGWLLGPEAALFKPGDLQRWKNLTDVKLIAIHHWFDTHHRIAKLDTRQHRVDFQCRSLGGLVDEKNLFARYYVENVFEALEPGEFYLDRPAGRLYYMPKPGQIPENTEVIAPRLETLVHFAGTRQANVQHIHLENLRFQHAEWDYAPDDPGSIQAGFKIPGAIRLDHAQHCVIYGCEVSACAQYGIDIQNGCHNNTIAACHIHDVGGGGVRIGHEWIDLVRETALALESPRLDRKPMATTVCDCIIHDCGLRYFSSIGIWVGNSGHNRILHNRVFDVPYTGISCGWSWGYRATATVGNRIEYNHVHHINWQRLLSDNAGIYTLGIQPGGTVRHNHVHHIGYYGYGGSGIYADEGTSEMRVENNVVHSAGETIFFTHYGRDNVVRNNLFAGAESAPIHLGRIDDHRSTIFERNIVLWQHGDCLRNWGAPPGHYLVRDNLLWPGEREVAFGSVPLEDWARAGQYVGTRRVDPLVMATEAGAPAIASDSPAWGMGFQPIDVTQTGPRFRGRRPARFVDYPPIPDPAEPIVRTQLEFRPGRKVRLTIHNVGLTPAAGRVKVVLNTQEGTCRLKGADTVAFTGLRPGRMRSWTFTYTATPGAEPAWVESLPAGDGLVPALAFYHVDAIATERAVPRLAVAPPLTQLGSILAEQEPCKVRWLGKTAGLVRLAAAGDCILLNVRVVDRHIHTRERAYEGSCVELFSSRATDRATTPDAYNGGCIHQILMTPATAERPAAALHLDGGRLVPAPDVQLVSAPITDGYELSARIPASLMKLHPDDRACLLEVVIDTILAVPVRATAFGSIAPCLNNARFGTVICRDSLKMSPCNSLEMSP